MVSTGQRCPLAEFSEHVDCLLEVATGLVVATQPAQRPSEAVLSAGFLEAVTQTPGRDQRRPLDDLVVVPEPPAVEIGRQCPSEPPYMCVVRVRCRGHR